MTAARAVGLGIALGLVGCWPPRMDTGLVQWDFTPVDAGAPAEIVEVYVPATKHLSIEACASAMDEDVHGQCEEFRAEDRAAGGGHAFAVDCEESLRDSNLRFCEWYGGVDIAEACRTGYQQREERRATLDGLPMNRVVCVRDRAIERQ